MSQEETTAYVPDEGERLSPWKSSTTEGLAAAWLADGDYLGDVLEAGLWFAAEVVRLRAGIAALLEAGDRLSYQCDRLVFAVPERQAFDAAAAALTAPSLPEADR